MRVAALAVLAACAGPATTTRPPPPRAKPVVLEVPPLVGRQIAATRGTTCAVTPDRGVACWSEAAPVRVRGVDLARGVIADAGQFCAWTESGTTWCWSDPQQPRWVHAVERAEELARSGLSLCLRDERGAVACGVVGIAGQLDDDPIRVPLDGPAAELAMANSATCARLVTGDVACWNESVLAPQVLDGLHHVTSLAGGVEEQAGGANWFTALRADGTTALIAAGSDGIAIVPGPAVPAGTTRLVGGAYACALPALACWHPLAPEAAVTVPALDHLVDATVGDAAVRDARRWRRDVLGRGRAA